MELRTSVLGSPVQVQSNDQSRGSFDVAYRRVATFLCIPQGRASNNRLYSVPVDPEELEAALARRRQLH